MADQFDVETALVSQIQGFLYPNGFAATSAISAPCRVYRGWPLSAALNADLTSGVVNVSVLPVANSIKPLTCFNDGWVGVATTPDMVAISNGNEVTFSGAAGAGLLAGLLVDGVPYVYRSVDGDTVSTVASSLAAMVSANIGAISNGGSVNIPGATRVVGRTAADVKIWREIRRQRQSFSVGFWSPTPQLRDIAASLVDLSFAGIKFILLPDGSDGRVTFADTVSQDQNQSASIYRRDLIYHVEYATVMQLTATEMLFGGLGIGTATIYS